MNTISNANCFIPLHCTKTSVNFYQKGWQLSLCSYGMFKTYLSVIVVAQPKRVKLTNCSQFLSHIFLGLDFHLYVVFLLIGIGQLDNDV